MVLSSFSLRGQTWGVVITNLAHQDEPVGRWIHRDCLLFWQVSVLVNLSGNYRINGAIVTWETWLILLQYYSITVFNFEYWVEYSKAQTNKIRQLHISFEVCKLIVYIAWSLYLVEYVLLISETAFLKLHLVTFSVTLNKNTFTPHTGD